MGKIQAKSIFRLVPIIGDLGRFLLAFTLISTINTINNEAKDIATNLNIADRAERQAFITLKDHKDNFQNKPTCRLINPAKSEIGRISKQLLENINTTIRRKTGLNQWKNSTSVINWFSSI